MFDTERLQLQKSIVQLLKKQNLRFADLEWNWIPFSGHWGISTTLFRISSINKDFKKELSVKNRAQVIALAIAETIKLPHGIEKVEAVNGYLNFYFDSAIYAKSVIDEIISSSEAFGKGADSGKTIMVEFSQPNTHKAFHVGHLRNMVLGAAVSNIIEFAGNQVVRANYIGDIGLHVIRWLWNYSKFHAGEMPPEEGQTRWMGEIYSEAVKRLEQNEELQREVGELFIRWDHQEEDVVELWKKTRNWSLEAFNEIYALMGIHFDRIYYESEVEDSGKEIVEDLIAKDLAIDERPEGAVIVDLDKLSGTKEEYRVMVILRSDGTSLYPTKDIPLAIKKFSEYDLARSIYVIDVRQSLYLKQIFHLLKLMGYEWAEKCYHLAYEIVNLPGNVTIASREGTVVLLEDLISELEERALGIVKEKNPDYGKESQIRIARKVALGALKYSLLSRDNTKIITFDWDAAMDMNGQAAPYLQYAHVRANSILRKVDFKIPSSEDILNEITSAEIQLIDMLSRFPQEVQKSANDYRPLLIANYAYELAKTFSNFYNRCPVLTEKESVKRFRLRLVAAFRQVISNSLALLGIEIPESM